MRSIIERKFKEPKMPASTPTKTRRAREENQKRMEILDVAERVFREKGYFLATTDEIAQESGYSVGTIYNCYERKQNLYGKVLERILQDLSDEVRREMGGRMGLERAIEALVAVRMRNRFRYGLVLQVLSYEQAQIVPFGVEGFSRSIMALYDGYVQTVAECLGHAMGEERAEDLVHMALALEGILTAFIGYCARPDTPGSLDNIVQYVQHTLLQSMKMQDGSRRQRPRSEKREIQISRFDYDRLMEILRVARWFADEEKQAHLKDLDRALQDARIVSPRDISSEVVTMNSRIGLVDPATMGERIVTLVFPSDTDAADGNISILDPLGTALLGARLGETIHWPEPGDSGSYKVSAILYQPEASGDYHL